VTSKNLEETVKNLTSEMRLLAKAKERSEQQMMSLKRENKRVQERLQSASEARAQSKDESRTLGVLRKTNTEMTERWQKEKMQRDAKAEELEKCRVDLHRIQGQLQKAVRGMDHVSKELVAKERTVTDLYSQLRAAKEAAVQAKTTVRRSQMIPPRISAKPSSSVLPNVSTSTTGTRERLPQQRQQHNSDHDATLGGGGSGDGLLSGQPTAQRQTADAMNGSASIPSLSPHDDSGGGDGGDTDGGVNYVRTRVVSILRRHDPTKVDRIDTLMERFRGRERFLLDKIVTRYEGDGGDAISSGGKSEGGGNGDHRFSSRAPRRGPGASPARDRKGGGGGGFTSRRSSIAPPASSGSGKISTRRRSEMALARHKERMNNRDSENASGSLLQSRLNG